MDTLTVDKWRGGYIPRHATLPIDRCINGNRDRPLMDRMPNSQDEVVAVAVMCARVRGCTCDPIIHVGRDHDEFSFLARVVHGPYCHLEINRPTKGNR